MGVYPNPLLPSSSTPLFLTPPFQPTLSCYPIPPHQDIFLAFIFFFFCIQFPTFSAVCHLPTVLSFFLHFLALCPILNRPSVFHFLNPTPPPIPLHSLPTKFLSLWGWNEGVLNVKSLVQMLTRTGHSRCCSDQAGHSTAQAGTPLVLQKRRA